jgi:sigma-B regulation protein RsbU (phosphoserine phosphatase)
MRELSRYTDPEEMFLVFSWRMNQIFPTARQLTISRRGLKRPHFRITRFNLWVEGSNPWRDAHRFPVQTGGILADLLNGADSPSPEDVYADQWLVRTERHFYRLREDSIRFRSNRFPQ